MSTREMAIVRFNTLSEKGLAEFIRWFDATISKDSQNAAATLTEDEKAVYSKLSDALNGFGEDFLPDGRPEFVPSKRDAL